MHKHLQTQIFRHTHKFYLHINLTRLHLTGCLLFGILLEIASYAALTEAAPADNLPENAFETSKRAGFVGMRGKKSDSEGDVDALTQLMYSGSWPSLHKRAGFVGMRGKKSYGKI